MSYFNDLSPYTYWGSFKEDQGAVNVGWLEGQCEYPTGPVPDGFVERLGWLDHLCVRATRGYQGCRLDPSAPSCREYPVSWGDHPGLGSAEIRVEAEDGMVYAAPNLIIHYVAVHGYRPPEPFIEAVMALDRPPDARTWYRRWDPERGVALGYDAELAND